MAWVPEPWIRTEGVSQKPGDPARRPFPSTCGFCLPLLPQCLMPRGFGVGPQGLNTHPGRAFCMVVHRACDLMAWSANQLPLPRQVARETGPGWEKGGGPSSRNGWGGEGRRERARVSCVLVVPSSGPMHSEDSPTHPPRGTGGTGSTWAPGGCCLAAHCSCVCSQVLWPLSAFAILVLVKSWLGNRDPEGPRVPRVVGTWERRSPVASGGGLGDSLTHTV